MPYPGTLQLGWQLATLQVIVGEQTLHEVFGQPTVVATSSGLQLLLDLHVYSRNKVVCCRPSWLVHVCLDNDVPMC